VDGEWMTGVRPSALIARQQKKKNEKLKISNQQSEFSQSVDKKM
jgi:hypothetical protein